MVICNLAVLAAERGLSLTKIAVETGLSRTTLSNLANHHWKGIQADTVTALCCYLNVELDQLLTVYPFDIDVVEWHRTEAQGPGIAFELIHKDYKRGAKHYLWEGDAIEIASGTYAVSLAKASDDLAQIIKALPPIAIKAIKARFEDCFLMNCPGKTCAEIAFEWEK